MAWEIMSRKFVKEIYSMTRAHQKSVAGKNNYFC